MILSWVILKTKATFSLQFKRSDKWLSCYVVIETFVSPCIFNNFNLKIFTPNSIWIWIDALNIPSLFIFKVLIPNKVCWHLTFSLTPPFKYILHINGVHCVNNVRIRSYSGLLFPIFELNTERYRLSLRIQSECGKMWTRITPNTDTFAHWYVLK